MVSNDPTFEVVSPGGNDKASMFLFRFFSEEDAETPDKGKKETREAGLMAGQSSAMARKERG
jgi:hypothetical protein